MSTARRVMWNGTVRALPLAEQLRAAQIAGCAALSVTPLDYVHWLGSGITTKDMLGMAADSGVALTHLDPFVRWTPDWRPVLPDGAPLPTEALAFDQDDFFRIASALQVESFTAFAGFQLGAYTEQQTIDSFGALCEAAACEGLRCDLEIIMIWGVPDLRTAWAIIDGAAAPNSGIMLDLWSYFRGNRDDELLRSIPGDRIGGVQLCDGPTQLPPGMSLDYEALFQRLVPGEGEWPVREILDILAGTGGLNNVGMEIFSTEFDAMSAEEIGKRCSGAMDILVPPTRGN